MRTGWVIKPNKERTLRTNFITAKTQVCSLHICLHEPEKLPLDEDISTKHDS